MLISHSSSSYDYCYRLVLVFKRDCQQSLIVRLYLLLLVRERSALADPYCQSAWNSVCLFVVEFVCPQL